MHPILVNDYSDQWFALFLRPIQASQTEAEVAFLARNLPQPRYQTILDLCCGAGRHTSRLAAMGYQLTGVDSNPNALEQAKARSDLGVIYILHDMRQIGQNRVSVYCGLYRF
jgi:ubiquinone/menaquinone biosynthesis C-methylase UbiE